LDHSLLDTSKVHLCNLRWPFLWPLFCKALFL
jgi:hypothetical protein